MSVAILFARADSVYKSIPLSLDYATHVIQSRKRDSRPHVAKAEREHTPIAMAQWLVKAALQIGAAK